MDKYEYRVKTEQMLDHLEKKEYQKAMDIAESIDWRRVKNASMLNTVSEIYEYNGEFKKGRDILFLAFDRAPGSRKIVYRLGTLALKIKDIREATDCYEEFVKLAPKDPNQYILKYKILRTQGAALSDQIAALEEFKKAEYIEKWAYELAKLYDEAGMTAECLEECDDLILWFSEGKYVYLAMELKMKYKPLTPLQQEKYDSRPGAVKKQPEPVKQTESTLEEVDDENEYDEGSEEEVQESTVQRIDDAQVQEIPPEPVPMQEEFEIPEEAAQADVVPKEVVPEETAAVEETPMYREEEPEASVETPEEHTSAIKQVVTGATLEEALAQGVAVASGINIEEEAMKEREDEILANGQMMIDDILQKWEAKQKDHEEAIAKQKAKDEERLQKEREQARIRQEEERKEVERKAAEAEARRKAEEEAARKADILFLAVKPNMYAQVIEEIKDEVKEETVIVAIAAGKDIATIEGLFGKKVKVVRSMPNTPALVGEAMSAICHNDLVTKEELEDVKAIFNSIGKAEIVGEYLMDAVTGVSGSSPAYVYMFIEAMADAAVLGGMPRNLAYEFAAQSVLGAAKMVLETGMHPGALKDMVTSPAGTTIEAVAELERKGMRSAVISAVDKCITKSKAMSK